MPRLPLYRKASKLSTEGLGRRLNARRDGGFYMGCAVPLSFINQYGVVAAAQARVASQSGKQALAEGAVLLPLAEFDAAADGPATMTSTPTSGRIAIRSG